MRGKKYCYSYRIRLEKLKARTWLLTILAKLVLFLVSVASDYFKRT
jgi:hypothetical protein